MLPPAKTTKPAPTKLLLLLAATLACTSCHYVSSIANTSANAVGGWFKDDDTTKTKAKPQINPQAIGGTSQAPVTAADVSTEGLMVTNPDDPDLEMPELEAAVKNNTGDEWIQSYNHAQAQALRQQRPLLVWFTNSQRSPTCKALSREVFASKDFQSLCDSQLLRCRIDEAVNDNKDQVKQAKRDYVKELRQRYNIRGNPTVIIFSADGQIVDTIKGYSPGNSDFTIARIKKMSAVAATRFEQSKQRLANSGFHNFTLPDGGKLMAKPLTLQNGHVTLQSSNGAVISTKLSSLQPADRQVVTTRLGPN